MWHFIRWLMGGLVVAVLATVVADRSAAAGDEIFVSIGTGELSGVYYPVGKAICLIVNQDIRVHGVRCSPEATPGSVYNIEALRDGQVDFAIIQSDVEFAAYNGKGAWLGHPFSDLRAVMLLYPELVTVMARANTPIHDLPDLAGRRINVGGRDSGTRATWDAIEMGLGWRGSERVHPVELRPDATISALCNGVIDASFMIVGHPSPAVAAQRLACAVSFVSVEGLAIDKLVRDHPYYQYGTIGATYGIGTETPTFGVRATLVASASVDTRTAAVVARELLTHISELRAMLPALSSLTVGEMPKDEQNAPLHPGAALIYTELQGHE